MPAVLTWLLETPPADPTSSPSIVTGAPTGDVALSWEPAAGCADLSVTNNDLTRDAGLRTAVSLSLFTDRQAEEGDVLPSGDPDRRGWWADAVPEIEGDKIGSRLWLLARGKGAPDVLARAEEYALEALQWLVDDKVAERISVEASMPRFGMLGLDVEIFRPQSKEPTRFRYSGAWTAEEP